MAGFDCVNERPSKNANMTLVEGIPQPQLDAEHISEAGRLFEGLGKQFAVDDSQTMLCPALSISRPALRAAGHDERLDVHNALTQAPILIEKVAEILNIRPELNSISASADIREQLLGDAEVHSLYERQKQSAALRYPTSV